MATNLAPPRLQTPSERPIAFLLDDQVSGAGPTEALTLYVRPEDLSRSDASRVTVHQTLGGAWGDSFGPAMPMITISGHTGWRRSADGLDGEARFLQLRERVFASWHDRRSRAVKAGRDPSGVQLVFSDALDNFAVVVAPLAFNLKRSKSRPLLVQYQLTMAVLSDSPGAPLRPSADAKQSRDIFQKLGLDSLGASLDKLKTYASNVKDFVDRNMVAPVKSFMDTTQQVLDRVRSAVSSIDGAAASLINVAQMATRSGMNLFKTLSSVAGIPARIKARLIEVATAYTNIFCVLKNALRARQLYEDYGDIYGASNCSSTSGGRPISKYTDQNTMQAVVPAPVASAVSVSPTAQSAMATLAGSDVVMNPLDKGTAVALAGTIGGGVIIK